MFNKLFLFILIFLFHFNVIADPAPLGIEINKATLSDVKKLYKIIETAPNATKGYYNYYVDVKNVDIQNLDKLTIIVNENEIVVAIVMSLPKNKFNELYNTLNQKYQLIYSEKPFVGDQFAKFKDGNSHIELIAPHMSFLLKLAYASSEFSDRCDMRVEQEKKDQEHQNNKNF